MPITQEQILKLAPDESSKKAGQQLAVSSKWGVKCMHEKALWGECQGSGSTPYRTIIDLQNLAFKCSCPSRKFPCKHGLGLFLLFCNQKNVFTAKETLDPHVAEWINKREAKSEVQHPPKEEKPIDKKAQQKRVDAREKKVEAGIEELSIWLKDVVRTGIAQIPQNPYQFSKNIIARMIDAQATGLAAWLKKIADINFYQEGWQRETTRLLANIYFLCEAYKNKNTLDENWQKELDIQIGWTIPKEEVLVQPPVADQWLVVSKTVESENNLTTEKIYLYGANSSRIGLLLYFYAAHQLPQHVFTSGSVFSGELCFYPGVLPLRALIRQQSPEKLTFKEVTGVTRLSEMVNLISSRLSENPFQKNIPFVLSKMKIVFEADNWFLQDETQDIFAIKNTEDLCWNILAISKAAQFSCFGIYENQKIQIHAVWLNHKFYSLL
ncbi:MAG: SWIM zinc finger family protein [Bacteroidia bacterium]|nr:SWIM zinc finger family protein [Bacteroidia bacterium]